MRFHLTMTGQYAGQTYCGKSRQDALADKEDFRHFRSDMTDEMLKSCCPLCLKVLCEAD